LETEKKNQTASIGVRVTFNMKNLMDRFLEMDTHISYGDLIRDAVREKIRRDAPELYAEMFEVGGERAE